MKRIYTLLLFVALTSTSIIAQIEGVWNMSPQAVALGVGPNLNDFSWWSNSADDVTTRACFFDDSFVFNADGTFENVVGDETWIEGWQGIAEDGCAAPVAPHDGSNAATWVVDDVAGTVTLTGVGAHLGIPKVINGAEISNPADAPASITYPYVIVADTMTVDINFGAGFWHFVLVKNTTATQEIVEDQFSFFPNPATSEIQVNADKQLDELIIRDITGRILIQRSNPSLKETIDVSALPTGMYLLESLADNKKAVEKLVIN